ncbi:MAG: hypothetical protein OXB92_09540 [Acidimicrobiaceae bacterium]|nr:hypothetical protein [Acidimicrobiia bacterium]MCY4494083.1 hypothetical protein [Acidimicrobiaceae bacterium]
MSYTTSTAEAVRRWIDESPSESILDAREAPGAPSNATRVALSRTATDPESPISFVRRHIYWKGGFPKSQWDTPFAAEPVDYTAAALAVAGAGSGLAGYSAAQFLGWTHEVLVAPEVAVVGCPPRGFEGKVLVHTRANTARCEMSRLEVALLEATIGFIRTGGFGIEYKPGHSHYCAWDSTPHDEAECLWDWGDAVAKLEGLRQSDAVNWRDVDPERLVRAAKSERLGGREMRSKISDLADTLTADSGSLLL